VGIHGVPDGYDDAIDKRTNWTLGCISLKSDDVKELYDFVRVGSPVTIVH
jgi:lipoprotein-anchoring transpeptidase ErfK/SrfK